jgi:hypothetical protein
MRQPCLRYDGAWQRFLVLLAQVNPNRPKGSGDIRHRAEV